MSSIFVSLLFHSLLLYLSSLIIIEPTFIREELLEIELLPVEKEVKFEVPVKPIPKKERPRRIGKKKIFPIEKVVAVAPRRDEVIGRPKDYQPAPKSVPLVSEGAGDILTGTISGIESRIPGTGQPSVEPTSSVGVEIFGEVTIRPLLYQKGFKIPEWVEKKGLSLVGEFKFWVMPDGSVERVSTERSFGYPSLDSLASSAILRWRFESLPKNMGYREEWGVANIKIRLK